MLASIELAAMAERAEAYVRLCAHSDKEAAMHILLRLHEMAAQFLVTHVNRADPAFERVLLEMQVLKSLAVQHMRMHELDDALSCMTNACKLYMAWFG